MRKLDQPDIVAALRHADQNFFVQLLLQKGREQLRILQFQTA